MAKQDKQDKEKCPRCSSTIFAKASDKSGKLYCHGKGCGHVWVPGLEGMNRTDVVLRQAQEENVQLKAELDKARKEVLTLKNKYEPADEIFS